MLAYGIVTASLLFPILAYMVYQMIRKEAIAAILALPIIMTGSYIGLSFVDLAPMALGILSIIFISIEAILSIIFIIIAIDSGDEGDAAGCFFVLVLLINAIVYLGIAL